MKCRAVDVIRANGSRANKLDASAGKQIGVNARDASYQEDVRSLDGGARDGASRHRSHVSDMPKGLMHMRDVLVSQDGQCHVERVAFTYLSALTCT
jgi:hypothetical protein